jgi:hypothetical protein
VAQAGSERTVVANGLGLWLFAAHFHMLPPGKWLWTERCADTKIDAFKAELFGDALRQGCSADWAISSEITASRAKVNGPADRGLP